MKNHRIIGKLSQIARIMVISLAGVLLASLPGYADKYKITRLNTPTIVIGGKTLKVGDTFDDPSTVKWSSPKQSMEVLNLATGQLNSFSQKLFRQKSVMSIKDYFIETKKTSRRDDSKIGKLTVSKNKDRYPEKRIALVIGNSNYDNLSYLRNARKDAEDVGECLSELGFDVMSFGETNVTDLHTALNRFASKAKNYDVALFYFSGHGLQNNGFNYLLPTDISLEYPSALRDCLSADDVLFKMKEAGTSNIVILDACRNIKSSWTRADEKGLAKMEGDINTVIVFSTASGYTASDGEGENSPFTTALIQNLIKPSKLYLETLNNVVRDTYNATGREQAPLMSGTLIINFTFKPEQPAPLPKTENNESSLPGAAEFAKGEELYHNANYQMSIDWYKKASDLGHPKAASHVGYQYSIGQGVIKDLKKAAEYYKIAAERGSATGQRHYAICLIFGDGVEQNQKEGFYWANESAQQGDIKGLDLLGQCYVNEIGTTQDLKKAYECFLKAAEEGYTNAQINLGVLYENGYYVTKDLGIAVMWYRKASDQGDPTAHSYLGYMYLFGWGVEQSISKAKEYFTMAAEKEDLLGMRYLGQFYAMNGASHYDLQKAKEWYRKAIDAGDEESKQRLQSLEEGHSTNKWGLPAPIFATLQLPEERGEEFFRKGYEANQAKDYTTAIYWYEKGASVEHPASLRNLGYLYQYGLGVKVDYDKAFDLYSQAATKGDPIAMLNLGVMYEYGQGINKDPATAVLWYRKAADTGHVTAIRFLGDCYLTGLGVAKDLQKAKEWYLKAAEAGDQEAQKMRDKYFPKK